MLSFIRGFFCFLGFIFFLLLCAGAYLWFADPFGMRPMLDALIGDTAVVSTTISDNVSERVGGEDKHPALNAAQERTLEMIGIDPAALPTSITPEQEECFIAKLGEARVAEIQAGASPTATDIFTARSCIE
jgi:hypothetical protein